MCGLYIWISLHSVLSIKMFHEAWCCYCCEVSFLVHSSNYLRKLQLDHQFFGSFPQHCFNFFCFDVSKYSIKWPHKSVFEGHLDVEAKKKPSQQKKKQVSEPVEYNAISLTTPNNQCFCCTQEQMLSVFVIFITDSKILGQFTPFARKRTQVGKQFRHIPIWSSWFFVEVWVSIHFSFRIHKEITKH